MQTKMREWFLKHARGPYAEFWLSAISFAESSFFPIPPDPFLIAILLANSSSWFRLVFFVSLSSVVGGAFGYMIGGFFFDMVGVKIIAAYSLEGEMVRIQMLFSENAFWAIFLAAFTPIPYKLFTISAGFFGIYFLTFIVASILGRASRFFIVAYLVKRFGKKIGDVVFKYFNLFSLLFGLYVVLVVLSLKFF